MSTGGWIREMGADGPKLRAAWIASAQTTKRGFGGANRAPDEPDQP
jgi:hypothetical protein